MHGYNLETKLKSESHLTPQTLKCQTQGPDTHNVLSSQLYPLAQVTCRLGDASCASAHATRLNRTKASQPLRGAQSVLRLQRQYGNRYVQRVLALSMQGVGNAEVTPEVERAIQRARGSGQALDSDVRAQMESAFGADFSGVRVHTSTEADTLNRALNARAFTTGQDIFFRQGAYSPGSSSGRELLAHEVTHVMQQEGGQVQNKLVIGQPRDKYEQEADRLAQEVVQAQESLNLEEVLAPVQIKDVKAQQTCPACEDFVLRKSLEEELEEEGLRVPSVEEATVSLQKSEIFMQPVTHHRPRIVQRSIQNAFDNYRGTCDCGENLGNNCAHYLSDAFIRTGYGELDGGVGHLYRRYNGRIVCRAGRPVRAREMRDWFDGRATSRQEGEPADEQYWAVYQLDSYPGGHVVLHHHSGTNYYPRGTGDYPTWGTQRHYTW
jgi:hypothetical protein